jgi:GntR family transcriptional repressor for pyruvate dehydrogenase complex
MEAVRKNISLMVKVGKETVNELLGVRKYIELGIAHLAAQNATKADLKELENLIQEMKRNKEDFYSYFATASQFHLKLALATKNKVFYLMERIIYDILMKAYSPILEDMFPAGPDRLINLNQQLLEAIKSKKPKTIDKAVQEHSKDEELSTSLYTNSSKRSA